MIQQVQGKVGATLGRTSYTKSLVKQKIHSHFEQTSRMLHHPHAGIRNLGSIIRVLGQDQILKTVNFRESTQREEVTIVFAAIVGDF